MDLRVDPMNIAIPVSLIGENERGQLKFTLYVQLPDGFLSREQLELAIQVSNKKNDIANNLSFCNYKCLINSKQMNSTKMQVSISPLLLQLHLTQPQPH